MVPDGSAGRPWRVAIAGFDGTDGSRCAVRWAAGQAARRGCRLHVVRVLEPVTPVAAGWTPVGVFTDERQRAAAEDQLLDEVDECRARFTGLDVRAFLHDGRPCVRLADYADQVDADVVAVGGSRRGALYRFVLGSTAAELARAIGRPVVAVRDATPVQQAGMITGQSSVVVCLDDADGPRTNGRLLEFAFDAAVHSDSAVTVVRLGAHRRHGAPLPAARGGIRLESPPDGLDRLVRPWCVRYPEVPVATDAVTEQPVQDLLERSEVARLLVVGEHRRGALPRLLSGSLSRTILLHAACSVAVVGASSIT